jgi:hypothetical protein
MKKLLVLLLALAFVVGISAQVSVSLATSGKANLLMKTSAYLDPQAGIAQDGEWNDSVTFKASGADGKYGMKLYYGQFNKTVTADSFDTLKLTNWSVWYTDNWGSVQIGTTTPGFNGDLNNDIIDKWDTDGTGTGVAYTTPTFGGFSAGVWYNIGTSNADAMDCLETSGFGAKYAIDKLLTVQGQVLLGLVADTTKANAKIDFVGVEGLDIYADAQYDQTKSDTLAAAGVQFVAGGLKAIAEFESNVGGDDILYTAVGQATYALNDKLSLRLRVAYLANTAALLEDPEYYAKAYAFYTIGNGLSANLMVGYDNVSEIIYQAYLGYSISM